MTISAFRSMFIIFIGAVTIGSGQSLRTHDADPIADLVAMVSETSYTSYLKALESFGTRHALQPNRDSVASWIAHQFREAGFADVVMDSFAYDTTRQWNVVATIAGSEPSAGEIVIGAHHDSQSFFPWQAPGADDNGSGTAGVLEIARVLAAASYTPRHTLRLITFGAEEMGLKGSEWYASRLVYDLRTVVFMINFDMIGTRSADKPDRDVNIVWYDNAYAEARQDSALVATYTTLTPSLTTQYRYNSDSWSFAQRGIKSVFHIESDFSIVYHSPSDSMNRLDLTYATDNVRGGLAMYLSQDGGAITAVPEVEVPGGWSLEQNYPNPFNPETNLEFRIANFGLVKISVFDALGREVAVLIDQEMAHGAHTVTWNARGMSSGQYFARMAGGGRVQTRPMLLVK